MKRMPPALTDTFRVDNWLLQNAPSTYGKRRHKSESLQLHLPGLEPFAPFDYWATLAVYSLLDPKNPTAAIETTASELLELLHFAREVTNALGYATFPSDKYDLLDDSLQRLYSVEVHWRNFFEIPKLDPKTGRRARGRPTGQWVEYNGRILQSYTYTWPPGVTPPDALPKNQRVNVNRAKTDKGEAGPPIWKHADGTHPSGIRLQLATDLVKGLTRQEGNIGATVLPVRIFALRKTFGPIPTATYLLVWVCRQTAKTMTRRLDGLAEELNVKGANRQRNRDTLATYFEMLKTAGVVTSFEVFEKEGESWVRFTKADEWHFAKQEVPPKLPAPEA